MKFSFQAKGSTGEVRQGSIEATSKDAAVNQLQDRGFIVLSIELQKPELPIIKDLQHIWEGVTLKELSVFYRQLATLIDAKVAIIPSLQAVGNQTDNAYLRTIIKEMVDDVQDGSSLSEAMSKHPAVFKNLSVSMVKAGELSGNLQRSITFLADNTENNYELNARIKSAMFYPGFVLAAALIIGFVVFTFVLPKLTVVFKDMNVTIPWYTKMLMNIGDFMSVYWWLVLLITLGVIVAAYYYVNTEDGRREWDIIKMKMPIFGKLFEYIYVSRFAENLSVLLDGGIPIVRALMIVSEVVDSTVYESVILRAADEVKTGGAMSGVFARSAYYPPIVAQMIKVGEDSGKVSEVLRNVSSFYSKEVDRIARNLSTLLEPIMIVVLGLGVAFIVFSVLVPIYNMVSVAGK